MVGFEPTWGKNTQYSTRQPEVPQWWKPRLIVWYLVCAAVILYALSFHRVVHSKILYVVVQQQYVSTTQRAKRWRFTSFIVLIYYVFTNIANRVRTKHLKNRRGGLGVGRFHAGQVLKILWTASHFLFFICWLLVAIVVAHSVYNIVNLNDTVKR